MCQVEDGAQVIDYFVSIVVTAQGMDNWVVI